MVLDIINIRAIVGMSNKTFKTEVSIPSHIDKCEDIEICENEFSKDESTDDRKDTLVSKDVESIDSQEKSTIQNTDELNTKDSKKHISESKINIGAYLRSEFTDVIAQDIKEKHDRTSELTTYKKIDPVRKRVNRKKPIRKKPNVYSEDTVVVQFLGSENLPEDKVQMFYEPESRNFTVKGMFAILFMMHFFVTFGLIYLTYLNDDGLQVWYNFYSHYLMVCGLIVTVILVACMICLEKMRDGFRSSVGVFGTLLSIVAFGAGLASIRDSPTCDTRIFLHSCGTMFWTDIVCIILGCTKFDYTSKLLYVIVIPSGAVFYFVVIILDSLLDHTPFSPEIVEPDKRINDLVLTSIFVLIVHVVTVSELHILLDNETVELAEDDYVFGAYLLFICLVDCPIRHLRKRGYLGDKDEGEGDGEEVTF